MPRMLHATTRSIVLCFTLLLCIALMARAQETRAGNLQKNIGIREGIRAAFRVDLINALNKQVLGNPSVNPLDTNFGRVSQFVNTPRLIQLTFRLTY